MTDTLILSDSVQFAENILSGESITPAVSINYWMWIAIAQFVVILYLLIDKFFTGVTSDKRKFKKEAVGEVVDFDNIIKSSFHAKQLFDELKVKCHPDKFPENPEENALADALFQEITRNKSNFRILTELKERAKTELNINF
jgi:hypothetical protein